MTLNGQKLSSRSASVTATALILCSVMAAFMEVSHGTTTSFNQTSFENDVTAGGGSLTLEDFNSFTSDVVVSGSFDVGPFTVSQTGSGFGDLLIDAVPNQFGLVGGDGTTHLSDGLAPGSFVTLDYDNPITAWGGDFLGVEENFAVRFTTSIGTETHIITPVPGFVGFFGIILDPGETINSLDLVSGANDAFALDNIQFATASTDSISESSTLLLLDSGLAGLGFLNRRRKRIVSL